MIADDPEATAALGQTPALAMTPAIPSAHKWFSTGSNPQGAYFVVHGRPFAVSDVDWES